MYGTETIFNCCGSVYFFFQAEDGIRDADVTGVQTCALPIFHRDAVQPGQRVLLVDDLLATGGTIAAAAHLVEQLGGEIVGFAFMIELAALGGRAKLGDREIFTLVRYEE